MDDARGPQQPPRARLPLSLSQRVWYRPHDPGVIAVEFLRTAMTRYLDGPLDAALLDRALDMLRQRHPILRTRYGWDGERAYQIVTPGEPQPMKQVDLSTLPDEMHERAVWTVLKTGYDQPLAYEAGRPITTWLFKLADNRHIFGAIIDHIALDNRSMEIIAEDLFAAYHTLVADEAPLAVDPPPYADHALASQARQGPDRTAENLEWWRERLDGVQPVDLHDPTKAPYPAVSRCAFLPLNFDANVRQAAFAFSREHRLSISMVMSCLFSLMFARWADTDRVLTAYVVDDRPIRLAETAGSFVRSMPYCLDLRGDPTGREVFERSRRAFLDALSPERVINANDIPNLARVLVNFHSPQTDRLPPKDRAELEARRRAAPRPGGLTVGAGRPRQRFLDTMSLDLQVYLTVHPDHLGGHIAYAADRLDPKMAEWFAQNAPLVLERLITRPEQAISALAPMPGANAG